MLSPNSAIQAQWVERAKELFDLDGRVSEIGTDPKNPGILTSLTYQSVTLPKRGGGELDDSAMELWISISVGKEGENYGHDEGPESDEDWNHQCVFE